MKNFEVGYDLMGKSSTFRFVFKQIKTVSSEKKVFLLVFSEMSFFNKPVFERYVFGRYVAKVIFTGRDLKENWTCNTYRNSTVASTESQDALIEFQ